MSFFLITTFSDLDLGWGSQDLHRTKFVGFIVFTVFQMNEVKCMAIKHFKLNILRPILFKLDVVTDTTIPYIEIHVYVTLISQTCEHI